MFFYVLLLLVLLGAVFCAVRMSVTDLRRRIIPDVYLIPFLFAGLLITNFVPWWCVTISDAIIGGSIGYCLGIIVNFIFEHLRKQQDFAPIGMGDIKLLGAGGIWLGTVGLAISMLLSCLLSVIWGWYKKEKYVPFAPF
ncbi:MAG: A24 family peptidase [Alphaproteobacteria bacterium]|nr:A24 family peptidase [Alphaproteobacteria bacterium]